MIIRAHLLGWTVIGLAVFGANPAAAQQGGSFLQNPTKPVVQPAAPPPPRPAPPPALPGSRAEPTAIAPADRNAADLPPTEALFDAINRGDMPTVRDALSRGADLNARNILGLSPVELAIDLSRNDIAFLLLSLRGAQGGSDTSTASTGPARQSSGRQASARQASAREAPARETRAERRAAARAAAAEADTSIQATSTGPAPRRGTATTPQAPRLFAGDGGAPIPQAGFLGFDARR